MNQDDWGKRESPAETQVRWQVLWEFDPERLVQWGQRHFAEAYPNPTRQGCSDSRTISQKVASGELPGGTLRDHLFRCSPCFEEYRAAVLVRKRPPPQAVRVRNPRSWGQWSWEWRRAIAVLACSILICITVAYVRFSRQDAPRFSQARSQPSGGLKDQAPGAELAPGPFKEPALSSSPPASTLEGRKGEKQEDLAAVTVDLREYRTLDELRSGEDKVTPPISLGKTRLRITLLLKEGHRRGRYQVSVLDSTDQVRDQRHGWARQDRRLAVTLDLRRMSGETGRLRIERLGQFDIAPEDYAVKVSTP